ncbi:Carns1, partial [Symbiodinium sp. KB8]
SGEEADLTDDDHVSLPSLDKHSLGAAVVLRCLQAGHFSWNSNCAILRSLEDLDIFYPGLNEAVMADIVFMTANATDWTLGCLQKAVGLPSDAYRKNLEDFLADALGASGEFLTSWRHLNEGSEAVDLAISWLCHVNWEYAFFPSEDGDRPAVLLVLFTVNDIAGCLVAVDREAAAFGHSLCAAVADLFWSSPAKCPNPRNTCYPMLGFGHSKERDTLHALNLCPLQFFPTMTAMKAEISNRLGPLRLWSASSLSAPRTTLTTNRHGSVGRAAALPANSHTDHVQTHFDPFIRHVRNKACLILARAGDRGHPYHADGYHLSPDGIAALTGMLTDYLEDAAIVVSDSTLCAVVVDKATEEEQAWWDEWYSTHRGTSNDLLALREQVQTCCRFVSGWIAYDPVREDFQEDVDTELKVLLVVAGNDLTLREWQEDAEDKAIGWSTQYFPGKRGNIQKDSKKTAELIIMCKVRLALRACYAHRIRIHLLRNPTQRVKAGLQDIACLCPEREGHSVSKANDKRWRLIWNVSEVDRLLDAYIHGDQTHLDVLTHQGENGDLGSLAVGC